MGEAALEDELERVVLTLAGRHAAPDDVLVLRILSERLRDVAVEARDTATECRRACARSELMSDCRTGVPSASTLGEFMFASTPNVCQ